LADWLFAYEINDFQHLLGFRERGDSMSESDQIRLLNAEPLNQAARKLLLRAGVAPDARVLHVLDLAQWRLEKPHPNVKDVQNVQDLVTSLANAPPHKALAFLLGEERQEDLVTGMENEASPEEAADRLLQQVASRGMEEVQYWAIPEPEQTERQPAGVLRGSDTARPSDEPTNAEIASNKGTPGGNKTPRVGGGGRGRAGKRAGAESALRPPKTSRKAFRAKTPAEMIAAAAELGVTGMDEAIKGIHALFGGALVPVEPASDKALSPDVSERSKLREPGQKLPRGAPKRSGAMNDPAKVKRIAEPACRRIARRVRLDLQRFPHTNGLILGDASPLINGWEELCGLVQGETGIYAWSVYQDMVQIAVEDNVAKLKQRELEAIWLLTDKALDFDEARPPIDESAVVDHIIQNYVYKLADKWSNPRIREYLDRIW